MTPTGPVLRRARFALWGLALVAATYLALRFETVVLPADGCSPLLAIAPGARLLVDVSPAGVSSGDVVLFRETAIDAGGDAVWLGRVQEAPPDLPQEAAAEIAAGALWVVGDHPRCPGRDSRLLGPIARGAVEGKVVFAW